MTIPYPAQHLCALALGILMAVTSTACHKAELSQHQESRPLMGTLVDIITEGPDPALLASAGATVHRCPESA